MSLYTILLNLIVRTSLPFPNSWQVKLYISTDIQENVVAMVTEALQQRVTMVTSYFMGLDYLDEICRIID